MNGNIDADLPIAPLGDEAPIYARPYKATVLAERMDAEFIPAPTDYEATLLKLLGSPDLASKRWIFQQYDHQVMADTLILPGGDASMVRVHGTKKGLAITTDCTPRYCFADPVEGGKQAVAETYRNIVATGAKPLAITNCLNFGNPQKPEIMGQIVGCLDGMSQACIALDYPIVSGNASLYNETNGTGIMPTPAIGGVGLIADYETRKTVAFKDEDEAIIVIGETKGDFGASIYCRDVCGCAKSAPPRVDLALERKNADFILAMNEFITACHDISDGGLVIALAEMAMAGNIGAEINKIKTSLPLHATLFAEDQARYVVTSKFPQTILNKAEEAGIFAQKIGKVKGNKLVIDDKIALTVDELKNTHENWMPEFMS